MLKPLGDLHGWHMSDAQAESNSTMIFYKQSMN
jgi:hypothetical protein